METPVNVTDLRPVETGWEAESSVGVLRSRFVVWATGEYCTPRTQGIPGLELCTHYAEVRRWKKLDGESFLILGAGESGVDAACHLVAQGKKVTVLDRDGSRAEGQIDPSIALAPVTRERLRTVQTSERFSLREQVKVTRVEECCEGFWVFDEEGTIFETDAPPITCLGFEGGTSQIPGVWESIQGTIRLTEHDESTVPPGLFPAGPPGPASGGDFLLHL